MRKFHAEDLPPKGHFHYHQGIFLSGVYQTYCLCKNAEYGARFNRLEFFDIVAEQVLLMKEKTQDAKTGLLYHAYDSSRKESWSDPVTGWKIAALVCMRLLSQRLCVQ